MAILLSSSISNAQIVVLDGSSVKDTIKYSGTTSDTVYYCQSIQVTTIGKVTDTMVMWNFKNPGIFSYYDTATCWVHDTTMPSPPDSTWFFINGASVKFHFIKLIPTSKICWVTADSNFAHNVIIWDTTGFKAENIDSVRVFYFVTSTSKKLLATCSRNVTYYVDSVNNPQSDSYKYLLAGVNGCDNEDTNSAWQTTAWIQQSSSTFTVVLPYTVQGDPSAVSYYILYRDTIGNGKTWDSIYETPTTVLHDSDYTKYPNAQYYVAAVLNTAGCTAPAITKRMESAMINKSRSNRLSNNITGIASIPNTESFIVYPNPNQGTFHIVINNINPQSIVKIYNTIGEEVFCGRLKAGDNNINLNEPSGIYLYRIISGDGESQGSGKFVIE